MLINNAVRSWVVKMGDSKGIRIPKPILEQLALGEEVELLVQGDQLVIWPGRRPRGGWEEQFARMTAHGDDRLLDEEAGNSTKWDEEAWEWK